MSLVALPDATASTLFGLFDVMNAFALMNALTTRSGTRSLFRADIVGETSGSVDLASGIPVAVQREIDTIETTDIVIVPSVLLRSHRWTKGRYPRLVDWLRLMHERGAVVCSACSGIFLLAETGLFDGKDATVHFEYAREFSRAYPAVSVHPQRALVRRPGVLPASLQADHRRCTGRVSQALSRSGIHPVEAGRPPFDESQTMSVSHETQDHPPHARCR